MDRIHLNLSGFPGSGKTTLLNILAKSLGDEAFIIPKDTTRPSRPGEDRVGEYRYVDPERMERRVLAGHYVFSPAPTHDGGEPYHTAVAKRDFWPEIPSRARVVLSGFGFEALTYLQKEWPEPKLINIFVGFRSMSILYSRLKARCGENVDSYEQKCRVIKRLLGLGIETFYPGRVVYNDGTPEETIEQIENMVGCNLL